MVGNVGVVMCLGEWWWCGDCALHLILRARFCFPSTLLISTHSGYGRVVVDPLVRLAYDARTDLGLHARHDL